MRVTFRDLFRPPPRIEDAGDIPPGRRAGVFRDATARLWVPFNVVFAALLLFATLVAVTDGDASAASRYGGLPLVAAGVVAYAWLVRPFGRGVAPGSWRAVAWVVVAAVLVIALLFVHPGYWFATFILFFQVWTLLPIAWAAVAAALLSLAVWMQPMVAAGEGIHVSPVGAAIFTVSVIVSTMLGLLIAAIARQSGERLALVRELQAERSARIDAERETGALAERARLSRDLHDSLAQQFTSAVMHLETALASLPPDHPARRPTEDAATISRGGLDEVRQLVWALRPAQLRDASIDGALERMVAGWSTEHGIAATFRRDGVATTLTPAVEVTLLRVAQEALTNVARHARATLVDMVLTTFADSVHLDIRDDGIGFAAQPAAADPLRGGFGLAGMRERVEALGGEVDIETEPGGGTTIAVTLPRAGGPIPVFDGDAGMVHADRTDATPHVEGRGR